MDQQDPSAIDVAERFRRYRRTRDARLRDELVLEHRGLADALARRYAGRGEPLEDLRQVAVLGLVKAVDRFDPDGGHAFSSFAVPTILGEIRRHFRDHGWAVHVPRRLQELQSQLGQARQILEQRMSRTPTAAEIADEIGTTPAEVASAMEASRAYATVPLHRSSRHLPEATPDELAAVDDRLVVRAALGGLDARELRVLRMRFAEERSQSEIGARIGVSQVHVSRLLRRTLHKLAAVVEPA